MKKEIEEFGLSLIREIENLESIICETMDEILYGKSIGRFEEVKPMKGEIFEKKIQPLIDVVHTLCNEEGIQFLAQFKPDGDKGCVYDYTSGNMVLDGSTIMTQHQKWLLKQQNKIMK